MRKNRTGDGRHLLVDVVEGFVADLAADGQVDIVAIGQTAATLLMMMMTVVDDVVVDADSSGGGGGSNSGGSRTAKEALGTCCKDFQNQTDADAEVTD